MKIKWWQAGIIIFTYYDLNVFFYCPLVLKYPPNPPMLKDKLYSQTFYITKKYFIYFFRHMLSADTKEERINWCNKINRALANIRTWHSDAMRPIRLPTTKT
jgi:hypothetical protein